MKKYSKGNKIDLTTAIVTADIGKSVHYGYLRCSLGDIKPFRFTNNLAGFKKLWNRTEEFMKAYELEKVVFGYESTGCYGDPLKLYMQQKGATLIQVNPMHTKRLKELSDNSPNKTDEKDPRVIADILMLGYGLTSVIPEGKIAELRELVQSRENRLEDINRVKNRMEAHLARHFPEFLHIMGLKTKTSIYLLANYPTAEDIAEKQLNKLNEEIYRISRARIKYSKVEKLHQAAIDSIGIKEGQQAYREEIKRQIEQLETFEKQLAEIEQQIEIITDGLPEARILKSIKGIGLITAAYLLSEIVDFKAYKVEKEVEKFAGLNLFEISSGEHKGQRRLSKRGRTLLRKALYMAVLNMIKKNGIYHNDYKRCLERGVKKVKAMVIVMKRLLRMTYSMVKKNETFIANYSDNGNHKLAA